MIEECMFVACPCHSLEFFDRTKRAFGLVRRRLSPTRQKKGIIFEVELFWPQELAHERVQIKEEDLMVLLRDVTEEEIQHRWPEALINLVQLTDCQQSEINFLKEASGLQFQEV